MSGLCGWIGYGKSVTDNRQHIARMAAPLTRFDETCARYLAGVNSAIAAAAPGGSVHIYFVEGLRIAVCGHIRLPAVMAAAAGGRDEDVALALVRLWREKGPRMCAEIGGAFALCIVDDAAGTALLAVDRAGTYPLSYHRAGACLLFGSTLRSLARHPLAAREVDPQALFSYLYFHMVPGPATILKGQKRLLPGECLLFKAGEVRIHKYWEMMFVETERLPFDELKREFLHVLKTSVRELIMDVEAGAFLSGGTDSSTIAGLISEVSGRRARTYSIGFEASGYDEMAYARIAARHFSTRHHEYYVTPEDVLSAVPLVAAIHDQPFGNASAIPAYYCARMARADGVERLLGGDGGDELFGGNERYARQFVFSLYARLPERLRRSILEPCAFNFADMQKLALLRKTFSYIRQASVPMPARLEVYNLVNHYGHAQMFTPEFLETIDPGHPHDFLEDAYQQTNAHTLINRMLALDMKLTLADSDLPKVMKACELAKVEAAFPFLDDAVVAFSARLEPSLKLKGTKLRHFFKEALRGVLPDEIIAKKKHGFGLPFGVWLQTNKALQSMAADSLTDLKARGIVRGEFIDRLMAVHLKEHASYHGTMVWLLIMLEQWFRLR